MNQSYIVYHADMTKDGVENIENHAILSRVAATQCVYVRYVIHGVLHSKAQAHKTLQ